MLSDWEASMQQSSLCLAYEAAKALKSIIDCVCKTVVATLLKCKWRVCVQPYVSFS